jgi:hypothetical protein
MLKRSIRSLKPGSERRDALKDGMYLAEILNGIEPGFPEDRERDRLISLLSELQSLARNPKGLNDQTAEDFANVNRVLRCYPWVVELVAIGAAGPVFADFPATPDSLSSLHMRVVVKLARLRLLGQLRRCPHCQQWFFGKISKKFCGEKCRQAAFRSTPRYKEHNRQYQAQHYRDYLSPVTAKHLRAKRNKKTRRRIP